MKIKTFNKKMKDVATKARRKVIGVTSDVLSAPARYKSKKAISKAKGDVFILKNDIDNRKPGNWTGSETQVRTRNMAEWIRMEHKRKQKKN